MKLKSWQKIGLGALGVVLVLRGGLGMVRILGVLALGYGVLWAGKKMVLLLTSPKPSTQNSEPLKICPHCHLVAHHGHQCPS